MAEKSTAEKRTRRIQQLKVIMKRATDPRTAPEEAENDLHNATRLMAIYGIEPGELEEKDGGLSRVEGVEMWEVEVSNKNFAGVMRRDAVHMITRAFGGQTVYYRRSTGGGNTRGFTVMVYATASTLETLKVILPSLLAYAENRQAAELNEKKNELKALPHLAARDRQRQADQWAKGWWASFGVATAAKIRRTREHAMDEYLGSGKGELVRQSDEGRVQAHVNDLYSKLRKGSGGRTAYSADAVAKGRQAGREALVGQDEVAREQQARTQLH